MFNLLEIIDKKALNQELTEAEITFFINDYVANKIEEYQMAAFLMAIKINGLSDSELSFFTKAMIASGKTFDLKEIDGLVVDKHSTGGIGDKVSLALVPLVAACGLKVAKMSGRGLGYTGGTLDKLESLPGFNVFLDELDFLKQVQKIGLAIIGQSQNLVPADKRIYALRDVTATVESIPLIASSIMSKKLALKTDAILLDVKVGKGAFMHNLADAKILASKMLKIAKALKRNVEVEISNMDQPLGLMIGNKNEVLEAISFLTNQSQGNFAKLVFSSAAKLLLMTKKVASLEAAQTLLKHKISSGEAFLKFQKMAIAQGVEPSFFLEKKYLNWWKPKFTLAVNAHDEGYFFISDAKIFGLAAVDLGAGRAKITDKIDYEAGIELLVETNQKVKKGDHLFSLFSSSPIDKMILAKLKVAYQIRKTITPIELLYKF